MRKKFSKEEIKQMTENELLDNLCEKTKFVMSMPPFMTKEERQEFWYRVKNSQPTCYVVTDEYMNELKRRGLIY